jgi:hypothetical protein
MSPESWQMYGVKKLGVGHGQRYRKERDRWIKVEG